MALPSRLAQLGELVLELLFPPRCVGCGSDEGFICSSCCQSLPQLVPPYCERCGTHVRQGNLCSACLRAPLTINGIRSQFLYEGAVREVIHQLKYKNLRAIATPLSRLLGEYLKSWPMPAEVLVPVPLHPRRLRQRGYNQSALVARELGKLTRLPVVEGSLVRLRNTPSQARAASSEERRANVQGAFGCQGQRLRGGKVLLIDDVCTTGATLDACAVALKEAGAASVWALTVAREI